MSGAIVLQRVFAIVLYFVVMAVALWAYAPGVNGPVLLDDHSSLGGLQQLSETPELALDHIFADKSGPLGRSISMATFVAEKVLGDGSAATSKWVNILLHLLNGSLLMLFLLQLSRAPAVECAALAAVLCAAVWLFAPLQVSSVLYLVQRMALLATFFVLLGLNLYLLWRAGLSQGRPRHRWLALALLVAVTGIFAKENALVCLPLMLVTEVFWLQCRDSQGRTIKGLQKTAHGLFWLCLLLVPVLLWLFWDYFSGSYLYRDFTLVERLMTQTRVLWDYLGQFFIPEVHRMGIFHDDYPVSVSLRQPATTLWALLGWLVVALAALSSLRWRVAARLAYGLVFFLVCHALESSVLPLELYFEHRNYLSGIGLAALLLALYATAAASGRSLSAPLLAWLGVYVVYLGLQTTSQVRIWSHSSLLTLHHVTGHPESARANLEYASLLAQLGAVDEALAYSRRGYLASQEQAAALNEYHGDYVLRNVALACLAQQPLHAVAYREVGRGGVGRPLSSVVTMGVVVQLSQQQVCEDFDWDGFLDHLAGLYLGSGSPKDASAAMFNALAMLANSRQQWRKAYDFNARHLALAPDSVRGLLMQLHFATALGDAGNAAAYITRLQRLQQEGKLSRSDEATLALYLEK